MTLLILLAILAAIVFIFRLMDKNGYQEHSQVFVFMCLVWTYLSYEILGSEFSGKHLIPEDNHFVRLFTWPLIAICLPGAIYQIFTKPQFFISQNPNHLRNIWAKLLKINKALTKEEEIKMLFLVGPLAWLISPFYIPGIVICLFKPDLGINSAIIVALTIIVSIFIGPATMLINKTTSRIFKIIEKI